MSLERLAAGVAGVEVVPVLHPLFGWVPAEEDDSAFAFVREVEQTHIQVFEDDAKLRNASYRQVEFVRLYAVLRTHLPAAVAGGGPQDRFHVRGPFAQGVAVERRLVQDLAQAG